MQATAIWIRFLTFYLLEDDYLFSGWDEVDLFYRLH